MTNWNMDEEKKLYHPQTSMPHGSQERTKSFQNSMVAMWQTMAKLFHPQWTKNNGEMGGQVFRDWTVELERFGSKGVLRGLGAVRISGSSYAPNLNKFIGYCIESNTGGTSPGDSFSEQLHGKMKETPNGVPLCWTIGAYTDDELRASPCHEDHTMADKTGGHGWSHPSV